LQQFHAVSFARDRQPTEHANRDQGQHDRPRLAPARVAPVSFSVSVRRDRSVLGVGDCSRERRTTRSIPSSSPSFGPRSRPRWAAAYRVHATRAAVGRAVRRRRGVDARRRARGPRSPSSATGRFPFAQVCYVTDMDGRLRAAWRQLFGSELGTVPVGAPADLWASLEAFMRTVAQMEGARPVDDRDRAPARRASAPLPAVPVDPERARRQRGCRRVGLRRDRPLRDERTHRAPQGRAAAGSTRSCGSRSRTRPSSHRTSRTPFSRDETVELVFDIVRNAANKIAVLFAADEPHVSEGVEFYDIDSAGDLVYGVTPA